MKAIVYNEYGNADVLRYADVDTPSIGPEDVLVRVHASSINFADHTVMLRGFPMVARLATGIRRPRIGILGRDIAGTVAAIGAQVTELAVGDRVLGEVNQRGFAEYAAARAAHLGRIPDGVTFEQAATLPVAGTTALQALRLGGAGAGSTVLVNGASGGVGTFTVQLAKALGAHVTGVCSTRNADLVRSIGADEIVDYTRDDVTKGPARFDVIVDLAGGYSLGGMRRLLKPDGVFVASSGTGGRVLGSIPRLAAIAATAPFHRQRKVRVAVTKRSVPDLEHLAGLVAAGTLAPVIERTYPLSETADAIRHLETTHAQGKIVLTT
ncbi:NAD(P)-dependent alcohol dehydrogenase [Micromonospora sp. CPCC 205371]|nr:NAD(P)-dependent alcohol dehydrogenase [Micromonospora sp. CPCC 205371]